MHGFQSYRQFLQIIRHTLGSLITTKDFINYLKTKLLINRFQFVNLINLISIPEFGHSLLIEKLLKLLIIEVVRWNMYQFLLIDSI